MGEIGSVRCKYCGNFAKYGEFCSRSCRQKWFIKYGIKDSNQKGMEEFMNV